MKQASIQTKKLTLNKTTVSLLGNANYFGYKSDPMAQSTLPECNSTITSTPAGLVF